MLSETVEFRVRKKGDYSLWEHILVYSRKKFEGDSHLDILMDIRAHIQTIMDSYHLPVAEVRWNYYHNNQGHYVSANSLSLLSDDVFLNREGTAELEGTDSYGVVIELLSPVYKSLAKYRGSVIDRETAEVVLRIESNYSHLVNRFLLIIAAEMEWRVESEPGEPEAVQLPIVFKP